MNVPVKSTANLRHIFSKKTLLFISLLFMVAIVSSPLISEANGWSSPNPYVYVETEAELRNAIDVAPEEGYNIVILKDIVLAAPLEIPDGKSVRLIGLAYPDGVCLFGANGMDTIIVKSGGWLSIQWGLVITHVEGDNGRGVYVERDGTCIIMGAVISGNTADVGGGVYNEGAFHLFPGDGRDGIISNNSATLGGGVYNEGTFEMSPSIRICYNVATKGGGVYNVGIFDNFDGRVIYENTALSGEGDDVFIENSAGEQSYLLLIGIAIIVAVVVGLLIYHSKHRKPSVVKGLVDSVNNMGNIVNCSIKVGCLHESEF